VTAICSLILAFDEPQMLKAVPPKYSEGWREERQSNDPSLMQNATRINADKQEGHVDKKKRKEGKTLSTLKAVAALSDFRNLIDEM